jgi:NADH-quinone oxidoreductase subunit M
VFGLNPSSLGAGPGPAPAADVRRWEAAAWVPLVVLTVAIGVYPRLVLALTDEPVRALVGVFAR